MKAKPGYLTTEFWLTVAVNVAVFVSAIQSYLPAKYAAIAGAVVTGNYAVARGLAKTNPTAPAVAPPMPKIVVTQSPPQPPPPPQP